MTCVGFTANAVDEYIVAHVAVQLQGSMTVKVRYALQSVASTATRLQQLRLLTEERTFDEVLRADDALACLDIGTLVWHGSHPPTRCLCCKPSLQMKHVWSLCRRDMLVMRWYSLTQACISQMRSLTRLEVSYIGTPFEPPMLDDILGSLPTLQHLCLHFSPVDRYRLQSSYSDVRVRPVDFPQSLLRYVPGV